MKQIIKCCVCGEHKLECSKHMCKNCYNRQYTPPLRVCGSCGELKPHHANGLCHNCYNKQCNRPLIKCKRCGELKPHGSKGLCQSCYQSDRAYKTTSRTPMYENKQCAAYLGIYVAERVLSVVFKNVNRMPNNTKGFDFVCNNGYKIDVKSCVNQKKNGKENLWLFGIKKNKIPDFFLCLAFDDRISLNPIHLWLIPSIEINDLSTLTISYKNLDSFSKYEKPINKVITCCNKLKV